MGSMQLASGEMILELRREARLMICIEKNMIFNDERMSSRRKKQKGRGRNEGNRVLCSILHKKKLRLKGVK